MHPGTSMTQVRNFICCSEVRKLDQDLLGPDKFAIQVKVITGYFRRFSKNYTKTVRLLKDQPLGRITREEATSKKVSVTWRWTVVKHGGFEGRLISDL
ncbi:hypothetical protein CHS0354_007792 [Potamilus streckersoni]|uniref:Uncharacterized protein n=1 Tax=Potamilus streckersoni TaxID=2493646 RepID=A0AAE0TF03_9BIVA|nr:hypothetical protein CHS0354_007792 [Potamilus streckersoni]